MNFIMTTGGGREYVMDRCLNCNMTTGGAHEPDCPIASMLVLDWRIDPGPHEEEFIFYTPGVLVPRIEAIA